MRNCHDDQEEDSTRGEHAEQRECVDARGSEAVAMWHGSVYLDVENNGGGRACRRISHIACTRCTKTLGMQNKEEMSFVVESDLGM
jgi:hypothetical protein